MGFYNLDLDSLARYTGRTVENLKKLSYGELEGMIGDMKKEKFLEENMRNEEDKEYARLVLKYFGAMELLRPWFTDAEIIHACAQTGVSAHDLCDEVFVPEGCACHYPDAEYIRTSVESVPRYTKDGEELMRRESKRCDVYRKAARYQGLRHGQVILNLLYSRYPGLSKFGFSAYEVDSVNRYDIYPSNHIYVPFHALMTGDIDRILFYNWKYCNSYNNGRYTVEEHEKAIRTKEAQEMFALVREIGRKEREAGHTGFVMESDGIRTCDGWVSSQVSSSGNVTMFIDRDLAQWQKEPVRPFMFIMAAPYALDRLITEVRWMIWFAPDNIRICHRDDFTGEHGICFGGDSYEKVSGYIVESAFGHRKNGEYHLMIRINCPELMEG